MNLNKLRHKPEIEIEGLISIKGKNGVVRYALREGEWCALYNTSIVLYRSPKFDGVGGIVKTVQHNGTRADIVKKIWELLNEDRSCA